MNADELKALSDKTFFDNDKGLINPAEHRRFNNETVDFIQDAYYATFVVDSTEKLAFWAQNAPGHDYTHVLIKPGIYTSSVGIKLKDTGTKTVVGMGGSLLNFASSAALSGITGYEAVNNDCYMTGVNVQVTGNIAVGFEACYNLIRCTATVKAESIDNAAFMSCGFLSHCSGYNTSIIARKASVYLNCTYLTNCYAETKMIIKGQESYNFKNCENLTGCLSEATGGWWATAFHYCNTLTNCTGNAQSHSNVEEGLSTGAAFYYCNKLVNCSGSGDNGITGYAFTSCIGLFMCSPTKKSKSATYSHCYMLQNKTQPVGETAEGGYNWS